MSPDSKAWSPMLDDQLRAFARAHIPTPVIGYRLGRRPDAITRRAEQLGLALDEHRGREVL